MRFAVYTFDGTIQRILDCPLSELPYNLAPDEGAEVCGPDVFDDTHWMGVDELVAIRPKEDYSLDALPLPCAVTIEGVEYPCTEQPTFEFDAPGRYLIRVDAGPRYLIKEFTLENSPLLA